MPADTPTQIQKTRERWLKRLYEVILFGTSFSMSIALILAIFFNNTAMYYVVLIVGASYAMAMVVYHFTFKKKTLPFKYALSFFIFMFFVAGTAILYLAGGYSGSTIATYYVFLIIFALLVEEKEAIIITSLVATIYLIFFFGEEFNVILSPMRDEIILRYSKVVLDMLGFFIIAYLVLVTSRNAKNAIKFYKLRSVRLSKIRERLEVLVRRRTNELEDSNKRLRKAQEELRKSYRELQKLDKRKDEFISIASHELQTPMASIHGFSQLLQDKKTFSSPEKRQKYLKIIEDETNRLSKMVKDMLNLSRIDLGTIKFDIEEVDIPRLLEELRLQLESAAKQKGLKLAVQTEKDLPKITTDKEKLQQTLINLITNSIKYTNKGSITVGAQRENGHIRFSVADTGVGIPKSQYDKIFQRFYQIESPYRRKVLGAGLGLSIVKEFVHVMGGKIWLKSKVGKGTTFYVTLPLKFKEPKKFKPPKSKRKITKGKTKAKRRKR